MIPRLTSRDERLDIAIAELNLSTRTQNMLESLGILFVEQLLNTPEPRIRATSGVGNTIMSEIFSALEDIGFHRDNNVK